MEYERKKPSISKTVGYSALFSVILHILILSREVYFDNTSKDNKDEAPQIRIVLQPSDKKQIVETSQKQNAYLPTDSRFLGKSNQQYDEQSIARTVDSFQEAGRGSPNGNRNSTANPDKIVTTKKIKFSDLGIRGDTTVRSPPQKTSSLASLGVKDGTQSKTGLAKSNDYVEDIPLGDVTNLNTTRYKYYAFYHRIRQKLEHHWGLELRKKVASLYRRGGRIPANVPKITSLTITLDKKGNIVKIVVNGTSGIRELDNIAIDSFNKAGPFPNPPKGMLEDGYANIEWGFVVKG